MILAQNLFGLTDLSPEFSKPDDCSWKGQYVLDNPHLEKEGDTFSTALTREGSNNYILFSKAAFKAISSIFLASLAFVLLFQFCLPRVLNLLSINLRLVGHSSGPSTRVRSTISVNKSGKRLVYRGIGIRYLQKLEVWYIGWKWNFRYTLLPSPTRW